MIDLGLPSGTKWACCNVGANSPTDSGDYFAWGETTTKSYYSESNYKWYSGGDTHKIIKYNLNSAYGTVDGRTELELEDDAAYVNWGPQWRTPSRDQGVELLDSCTSEWTTVNGINGYLFKSNTNNKAIFLPAVGYYPMSKIRGLGTACVYWLNTYNYYNSNYGAAKGVSLSFLYGEMGWLNVAFFGRQYGATVRAVHVGQ